MLKLISVVISAAMACAPLVAHAGSGVDSRVSASHSDSDTSADDRDDDQFLPFVLERTPGAGHQQATAVWTPKVPTIDTVNGRLTPGDWTRAVGVHVEARGDGSVSPGIVPIEGEIVFPVKEADDLSFDFYALYDNNNLYVAVDVTDDIDIYQYASNEQWYPWANDCVEIEIDGDRHGGDSTWIISKTVHSEDDPGGMDWQGFAANKEGFHLIFSRYGGRYQDYVGIDWDAVSANRGDGSGYIVEYIIPLSSIDTNDGGHWTDSDPTDPTEFETEQGFRYPDRFVSKGATWEDQDGDGVVRSWLINSESPWGHDAYLKDPSMERHPRPGIRIGFNVNVGDDDSGDPLTWSGDPFDPESPDDRMDYTVELGDSFLAWDGNQRLFKHFREADWGTLYLRREERK